jgi:hypothetical protein
VRSPEEPFATGFASDQLNDENLPGLRDGKF